MIFRCITKQIFGCVDIFFFHFHESLKTRGREGVTLVTKVLCNFIGIQYHVQVIVLRMSLLGERPSQRRCWIPPRGVPLN